MDKFHKNQEVLLYLNITVIFFLIPDRCNACGNFENRREKNVLLQNELEDFELNYEICNANRHTMNDTDKKCM